MLSIKKIKEFIEENKDDIIETKINTYPIDEIKFTEWINNHSLKYREEASKFRSKTIHISFDRFKEKLGQICGEIREIYSKYENIVLIIPNKMDKSNFWISCYIFYYLMDIVTHVVFNIQDFDHIKEKSLIIIVDDASYSGKQISLYSQGALKSPHHILFAIPYMSNNALKKIKSEFVSNKLNILMCESTEIFYIFNGGQKKLYPIYFDHKLADMVSTYQLTYSLGRDQVTKDTEFKYIPMSLIKGCELYKIVDPYIDTEDILYDVGKENMCPLPFYKNIKYLYKGKIIKDFSIFY